MIIIIVVINTIFDSNWDIRNIDQMSTYLSDTLDYYQRHGTAWYHRNLSDVPNKIQDWADWYSGARTPEQITRDASIRAGEKMVNNTVESVSNWGKDTYNYVASNIGSWLWTVDTSGPYRLNV